VERDDRREDANDDCLASMETPLLDKDINIQLLFIFTLLAWYY